MEKDRYHHGNLADTLVKKAVESLAQENELPSLRSLAKRSGVSPAAVYRHFQNKDQMIAAVAEYGFDILEAKFSRSAGSVERDSPSDSSSARQNFTAIGVAYIEFASDYPELFRICFGREAAEYRRSGGSSGRPSTLGYLYKVIDGLYAAGLIKSPANDRSVIFAWSLIHGLVTLTEAGVNTAAMGMGENPRDSASKLTELIIHQYR